MSCQEFIPHSECTNASAGCWYAGQCLYKCKKSRAMLTVGEHDKVKTELKLVLRFVQSVPGMEGKSEAVNALINIRQKLGIYD